MAIQCGYLTDAYRTLADIRMVINLRTIMELVACETQMERQIDILFRRLYHPL